MVKYQRSFNVLELKEGAQLEEDKDLKSIKNDEFYLEPKNYLTQLSQYYSEAIW
jgi:hypothetical protein